MPDKPAYLTSTRPIIDESGAATQEMRSWSQLVTDLLMSSGTGSPEGVIEARPRALYMDDAGTAGSILYVKRDGDITGDRTKGWILV